MCRLLFNDQRVVTVGLAIWTLLCVCVFLHIMIEDGSAFLAIGPNAKTRLFNVPTSTGSGSATRSSSATTYLRATARCCASLPPTVSECQCVCQSSPINSHRRE